MNQKGMNADNHGRIYLDNAATTRVSEEVIREMIPYLTTYYGNPSSPHSFGYESNRGIKIARKRVSALIGAHPSEIIFTGSGTEADNLAIKGAAPIILEIDFQIRIILLRPQLSTTL